MCPRCGEGTADHEYCQTCGLNLHAEPELPTRAQWEQREFRPPSETATSGAWTTASAWWKRRPTKARAAVFVALAALVVAPVVILLAGSGNSTPVSDLGEAGQRDPESNELPEQRCVEAWNAEDHPGRTVAGVGLGQARDIYVSVLFAADFPDKCLVTVAIADSNSAFQFIESRGEPPWRPVEGSIPVSSLDSQTKAWNATVTDPDGAIELGSP